MSKKNPLDNEFPDIFSKPGQFLPNIGEKSKGEFDLKKLDTKVLKKATDLQ